ncbi:MAG: ATP-binding protein [Sedimentisphaerales bacterium]
MSVKLRALPSTLLLIAGESYRVGQIGAFLRIPLGYSQLYGICTKIGADAIPSNVINQDETRRWISITLFGEAVGGFFERGVSQYPTVGDEVHLVTNNDLATIYRSTESDTQITIGNLAASSGIAGNLDLGKVLSRHCAVVGSTGTGKSNFVAILLDAISSKRFPKSRVLVVDPHGEYGSCVGENGYVFRIRPKTASKEKLLEVPFWALPFDDLRNIAMGGMQSANETYVADEIIQMKREKATALKLKVPSSEITADSPIPFNMRELWFRLDCKERQTYKDNQGQIPLQPTKAGNANTFTSNEYPPPSPGMKEPYAARPRGLQRNLDFMRSRIQDDNYGFLFNKESKYNLKEDGKLPSDIDVLVASWVGHDKPLTVLDVSGVPSETTAAVVGTLIRIVYDTLFWGGSLPIGGRQQPLMIVLEEAHLFLPEGGSGPAHRTIGKIAKEGRKYGVGMTIVTQRPGEVDSTVVSQCGTMVAMRLTNRTDRSAVAAMMPDDLGDLTAMLPSLRTGEALITGEGMPIPSRIQVWRAANKPVGDNPDLGAAWSTGARPDSKLYAQAVKNWRAKSFQG